MQNNIILDQIKKRRGFPVPELGDQVYVRALTRGELFTLGQLRADAKKPDAQPLFEELDGREDDGTTDFMLGCVVCDKDGSPAIPREADEDLKAYIARVREATLGIDVYTLPILTSAVNRIGTIPPAETVVGN